MGGERQGEECNTSGGDAVDGFLQDRTLFPGGQVKLFRPRQQPEQFLNIKFRGGFALPELDLETGSTD